MSGNRCDVTIVYEDHLGSGKEFGPHKFVMACVFDRLNGDYHPLNKRVEPRPVNGAGNIKKAIHHLCTEAGGCVVAVYDSDRVRKLWQCPPTATDAEVAAKIKEAVGNPTAPLHIIFLERNTESLLYAADDCGAQFDANLFEKAVAYKDLNARDILFKRMAHPERRSIRDCVLESVPSARYLVQIIGQLLSARPLGAAAH